ncbi:DUF2309 domain-containing protein [Fibrisoma montanum]|uniref:Probable inorganic carbon transporter subunit DabA n=1 Tax=Fibrisoma montanum TaxID=2305895 RepID=A0A418LWV3_9BACT|nr:DUF2309 domain-containing protein [Fibrisoma montanum]RIV17712.1 DUF2309 domain-containing protein [Fibrisoma montanum]
MQVQTTFQSIIPLSVATGRAEIRTKVANAATLLSPVWPLRTFIACNPLQGLEALPFEEALADGARLFQHPQVSPELEAVNLQVIKWCLAFTDDGQATITMPNRHKGFYRAWKDLARFDDQLHQHNRTVKNWLKALPEKAEDALLLSLDRLNVPKTNHEPFLKQTLTYLPGWAGYIKWRSQEQPASYAACPATLVDFLAVRLAITCVIWPEAGRQQPESTPAPGILSQTVARLEKAETTYRNALLENVLASTHQLTKPAARPDAQLVFCIDVRSEPFRRRLEALGAYETLGFAGFFGLPVRLHDFVQDKAHDACPVLLRPRHDIYEKPLTENPGQVTRFQRGKRILTLLKSFYEDLKYNFATPFALVETLGAACGVLMLGRTLAPVISVNGRRMLKETVRPPLLTEPDVVGAYPEHGIAPDQQVTYAETALRLMGLTSNFGKLVVFCGHGAATQNNPYASALECGACGGNHGGPNARILATLLNTPLVRARLAEKGIRIPTSTVFLAAEHNTTTDAVTLYETADANRHHLPVLLRLKRDLTAAQAANASTRCQAFGPDADGCDPVKQTLRRSSDWAEVRPEWGLARNAAFIVGPRRLTEGLDLEGRCFLHSYDWQQDTDLSSLQTILTAPMVVAQWINSQYLFSTLDPVAYGSGSKITHNVAGKLGVMQGNASDLMHGLPLQSVYRTDDTPYHVPQRLLTVVHAPRHSIDRIIQAQKTLQTLFLNGWVTLVAIDPLENRAYRLDRLGEWQRWSPDQGSTLPVRDNYATGMTNTGIVA